MDSHIKNLAITLFLLIIVVFINKFSAANGDLDPYQTLGVPRRASQKEIKQAYKRLVMEWHPDKNPEPEAGETFMRINKAYEILSDSERREQFDRYGTTEDGRVGGHRDQFYGQRMHHGEFDNFFNFAYGGFGQQKKGQKSFFEKHRVTYQMYASMAEKSHTQPFLIYAYSSYCQSCFVLESVWKEVVQDLEPLGYGIGTVNYIFDGALFEKLRISQLPAIVALIEGRPIHFRMTNLNSANARAIRIFARDAIPNTFLHRMHSHTQLRRFLDQWDSTNKVSVLIFGPKEEPKLRYLLAAMKFSHFARFAYVHSNQLSNDVKELRKALDVGCSDCESVQIFAEDPENGPVAKLSAPVGHQFSGQELLNFIEKHKLLLFPRASSNEYFDELCPVSPRTMRHLCAIFVLGEGQADSLLLRTIRESLKPYQIKFAGERTHVAHIFSNRQREFLAQFLQNNEDPTSANSKVLVLWRYEYVKAKFSWISAEVFSSFFTDDKGNNRRRVTPNGVEALREHLRLLSQGTYRMDRTANVLRLNDEYSPSWFTRVSRQIVRFFQNCYFHLTKEETLPVVSVVGTLFFVFFVGFLLSYFTSADNTTAGNDKKEQDEDVSSPCQDSSSPPSKQQQKEWHPEDPIVTAADKQQRITTRIWQTMQPLMHELRAETYFGLIRLLKPGCRSIIVLVDPESKDILLPKFARQVYSLRNNKTFSFGFLMVNKNLAWFRSLLELTLPEEDEQPIDAERRESKGSSASATLSTVSTTLTESSSNTVTAPLLEGEDDQQDQDINVHPSPSPNAKCQPLPRKSTRDRLKRINPKQTLGTVLVLCGWKLYFCMYHPMHRPISTRANDSGGDSDSDTMAGDLEGNRNKKQQRKNTLPKAALHLNVENVLDGFPMFLDRLLEGSMRRYYIPEWPDNLK